MALKFESDAVGEDGAAVPGVVWFYSFIAVGCWGFMAG